MPSRKIWKNIQRYLSGDCTPDERRQTEQWMNEDPDNEKLVYELRKILELAPKERFEVNVDHAWKQFREHQMKQPRLKKMRYRSSRKADWKTILFRAAAVFFLATFVGFFIWQFSISSQQLKKEPTVTIRNVATQRGTTKKVTFSDGTTVTLNAASSLRFPEKFKKVKREVYLQGEAYFSVASNKSRPFIVHTSNAVVKVLGTEFDVQSWKGSKKTVVGVREGKVEVINSDSLAQQFSRVFLTNGQAVTVKEGQISDLRTINVDNMALWRSGGLYFNHTPFAKAVKQIERQYDIDIKIQRTRLKKVPFTGTFKRAGLDEVLNVVATSMGIRYVRKDSAIVFK